MDKNFCMKETQDQIFNDNHHKPLEGPGFLNTTAKIIQLLLGVWLDKKQVEYLGPAHNPWPHIFQTLLKIHKLMDTYFVPNITP